MQAGGTNLQDLGLDSNESFFTASDDDGDLEDGEAIGNVEDNGNAAQVIETEGEAEWQTVTAGVDRRPRPAPVFHGTPGLHPHFDVPQDVETGIESILGQFLPDSLLQSLCDWTNNRAAKEIASVQQRGEELQWKLKKWKPCSLEEMKKFVGILLHMGLVQKHDISMYWSKDPTYYQPFFHESSCLPRNRFQLILSWFRCYDCNEVNGEDPLCKVRPFLAAVLVICKNNYMPHQELAVDESLLLYKGRLLFRQYMPNKKARCGIKLYCLAESSSGYLWNFLVHSTAAQNSLFGMDAPQLSLSERIVVELSQEILDLGYRVFCDTWFSSVRLAEWLLQRGTTLTGTVRQQRGIPAVLRNQTPQPPSSAFARRGDLLAVKIVDRRTSGLKTVYMLDSAGSADCVQVTRKLRGGLEQQILKSQTALEYNRCMGGVDRMDAGSEPYNPSRRTQKWFFKLASYLLLQLVRNSWIAYRHLGGSRTFLRYLEACQRILICSTGNVRMRAVSLPQQQHPPPQEQNATRLHLPVRLQPTATQRHPTKRCRACSEVGVQKRTVFTCGMCNGQPGLCVDPCFGRWHQGQH